MSDDAAKELLTAIKQVNSGQLAEFLVGKPKQKKQSRHLKKMTYYRERFALQMKVIIDAMMAEAKEGKFEERFFAYDQYNHVLNKNSLYLKINQSWLYLRNELDPTGIYNQFAEIISIDRKSKDGIRITYEKDITEPVDADLIPTKVLTEDEQQSNLRNHIDHFLENSAINEELNMTKLRLNEEQMSQIDASLCQLDNITYKIFPTKIWIVKIA
jgi:hypothetical protein